MAGLPINKATAKQAVAYVVSSEGLEAVEHSRWSASPGISYDIKNQYPPEYLIISNALNGDAKDSSKFFADSFCGIPLDVDWTAEPNTIKLLDKVSGKQLLAIINLEEPKL